MAVYDSLQQKDCNTSLESRKRCRPTPGPCKYKAVAIKDNRLNDPDISVFVDPVEGSDDNSGTNSQPVNTI